GPGAAQRQNLARRASPWERLRRAIFWAHLVAGLVAGLFVALMSLTGIVLAFQTDILSFLDRDVRRVSAPPGASRQGLDALMAEAQAARPDFEGRGVRIPSRPDEAYLWFGRGEEDLYLDPYTGELSAPRST